MSRIFFDDFLDLTDLEKEIKSMVLANEEKEELWDIIDDTINHKVLSVILKKLPKDNHVEFLEMFHVYPHDSELTKYLKEKIGDNIEELIRTEVGTIASELLQSLKRK